MLGYSSYHDPSKSEVKPAESNTTLNLCWYAMALKIIIVILFVLVVLSLSRALFYLLKDQNNPRKRVLYALGIRICLAALLLLCMFYGFYTGQLSSHAPWDHGPEHQAHKSS